MLVVTIATDELWGWNIVLHITEGQLTTIEERLVIGLMCCKQSVVTLVLCTIHCCFRTTCKEVSSRHICRCVGVEVGQSTEINSHAIGTIYLNNALCILSNRTAICHDARCTIIALWGCCAMIILAGNLTIKGNRCLIVIINGITYVTPVLILQCKGCIDFTVL